MLARGTAATRGPKPRGVPKACSQEVPTESTQQSDRQEAGNTGRLVSQPECTNKEKKKKKAVYTTPVIGWFLRNYFLLWAKRL